jgi:predicted RNase H-like HicB family nuclease
MKAQISDYPILIFWSDDDNCFIADIPDLSFCTGFGKTPEEALKEVIDAQTAWISSAKMDGVALPKSRFSSSVRRSTVRSGKASV